MNGLSKLQKGLLCAGVVLILAALILAPKYWDYCEKREMKATFAALVAVENWPEETKIRVGHSQKPLEAADAARVKAAIQKLEFDGAHTDERYIKTLYAGGHDFSVIRFWVFMPEYYWDGYYYYVADYCIIKDFVVKNTGELNQVLQELQAKYPE